MMELPLRILVSMIVAGLTVPAILGGLEVYEIEEASARAIRAIEDVVRTAQRFFLSGGGVSDVPVDLRGGATARVESVRFGDAPGGPHASSAAYRVSGQPEAFFLADPPVPMTQGSGPLRLSPGLHLVRVTYDGDGPVRLAVA